MFVTHQINEHFNKLIEVIPYFYFINFLLHFDTDHLFIGSKTFLEVP